ncbi:MAG: hypothetical protein KAH32_01165 [Chlamydiia bacterium]|nr:hypothetical protein [Chlamydiia bacterium]
MSKDVANLNILITNDDGIFSPGVPLLYNIAKGLGKITVICPCINQSCVSKGLLLPNHPVRVYSGALCNGYNENIFVSTGTPTDCVAIASQSEDFDTPDIVLSGINIGSNVGCTTAISGTFGAAEMSIAFGIKKAIAFSYGNFHTINENDILKFREQLRSVISDVLNAKISRTVINITIPENPQGIVIAEQSNCWLGTKVVKNIDGTYSGICEVKDKDLMVSGDDFDVSERSLIAITPIKIGSYPCRDTSEFLKSSCNSILLNTVD